MSLWESSFLLRGCCEEVSFRIFSVFFFLRFSLWVCSVFSSRSCEIDLMVFSSSTFLPLPIAGCTKRSRWNLEPARDCSNASAIGEFETQQKKKTRHRNVKSFHRLSHFHHPLFDTQPAIYSIVFNGGLSAPMFFAQSRKTEVLCMKHSLCACEKNVIRCHNGLHPPLAWMDTLTHNADIMHSDNDITNFPSAHSRVRCEVGLSC